jgi:hypothetical protein
VLRYIANGASNQRMLKAIAEQPDRLIKEMDRAIGRIIQEMAVTAKIKAPKAMSTLTNSIIPEQLSRFEGVVRANVSYAEAVEKGTEPRDPDMDQEDVAWAIARKISWTGTKPQPFFEPTLEEKSAWADKRIEQAIDNALGLA